MRKRDHDNLDPECPVSDRLFIRSLADDNPFLGWLVSAMMECYNDSRCFFRVFVAEALVRVLYRAGAVAEIRSFDDFDDPMLFWRLLAAARAEDPAGGRTAPVRGLWCLYRKVAHSHKFPEEFVRHEKSIFYVIGKMEMLDLMGDHRVTEENYFAVAFKKERSYNGHPVVLFYASAYLRDRVARSARNWAVDNYFYDIRLCRELIEGFERFFEAPEEIRSYEDFTPRRLSAAVAAIQAAYPVSSKFRMANLKLLFLVWQDLMYDFPDYDFFKDSSVYAAETVMNFSTPRFLSEGYVLCVAGRDAVLEPMEKVLFIVDNDDRRTSTRLRYRQRGVDFSRITDLRWRKAVVNYAQECLLRGNEARFGVVIRHLADFLAVRIPGENPYHFTTLDYRLMRSLVAGLDAEPSSKSVKLGTLCRFVRWCVQHEYITADSRFWKSVRNFRTKGRKCPSSLSLEEIDALDKAFEELGKRETRFLLDRCVMHIQLLTTIRTGQICATMLSQLQWHDDGACTAHQLTKTSGGRPVKNYHSPEAAAWMRRAMDISRPLREACPVGGPKDYVFVYRNKHHATKLYHPLTVSTFTIDLHDACDLAGIRRITSGNVRDTAITARQKMARKIGLSQMEADAFVGHVSKVSTNAYDDIDFRDVLADVDGFNIGGLR